MMFYSLSRRRRAFFVGACALIAVISVVALVASRRGESIGGVPVVVVPGYGGDASTVGTLVEHLGRTGRRVLAVTLPQRGIGDIGGSAEALARTVAGLGAERVDLVGFSAGGIVVRAFLQERGAMVARNVVLLGAPNHGTDEAALALGLDPSLCRDACAQLVPGSSFLGELNSGDTTPGNASYFSIWTALDETVTPPTSAVLPGAVNVRLQEVCPSASISHGELVTEPLPLAAALQAVRGVIKPSNLDC